MNICIYISFTFKRKNCVLWSELIEQGVDGFIDDIDAEQYDLVAQFLREAFDIAFGEDAAAEAHVDDLFDAAFQARDAAQLAAEAHLSHHYGLRIDATVAE